MAVPLASILDVQDADAALYAQAGEVAIGYRIRQASAIVRGEVGDVDDRIADSTLDADLVSGVVVDMVLRYLRNPDGKVQESIDDYSYRRSDATATGALYITDAEVLSLSPRVSRAFTVRPTGSPDACYPTRSLCWPC